MRVQIGREPQDALDQQERRIAALQEQLDSLTAAADHQREIDARTKEELPVAEADLESDLRALLTQLGEVRQRVRALVSKHQSITARFGDLAAQQKGYSKVVGLKHRERFILAGSESPLFQAILGDYDALTLFFRECAEAGLSVPGERVTSASAARTHKPLAPKPDNSAAIADEIQAERQSNELDRIKKMRRKAA